jgi:xanthine dehydrogenase small subunit
MTPSRTGHPAFRRTLRFILDGEIIELDDVDPNRTILQFLREDLGRTGTKEGCAEGDCGACTVVVADVPESGKRLRARAVNSCIQFLPVIDGKELLTVESLSDSGDDLHPAQKAMIDHHGSQCGFCTPGFVMSLFALHKTEPAPTRRNIDEALAGNLCRCTGYRPIVDAAIAMYAARAVTDNWLTQPCDSAVGADERQRIGKLKALSADKPLCVEGNGRKFYSPRKLDQFAALVTEYPSATILAGGTDVALWVTKQYRNPEILIYSGNVSSLNDLEISDGYMNIGAAVSLTDAMAMIVAHYPSLQPLFIRFASPPIRNAATLGGNIANGSPIGDSMPVLMVLGTELILRSGKETRSMTLEEFYLAYQQTALRSGEFIERIRIPLCDGDVFVQSYKVSKRFDQDISAVCGAYRLRLDDEKVAEVKVAYGGMAEVPARAPRCEQSLLDQEWTEVSIDRAMQALDEDFSPISDMRASAVYRRQVCKNLLKRFYLETSGLTDIEVYSHGR